MLQAVASRKITEIAHLGKDAEIRRLKVGRRLLPLLQKQLFFEQQCKFIQDASCFWTIENMDWVEPSAILKVVVSCFHIERVLFVVGGSFGIS